MPRSIRLCLNCLETGATGCPVGSERGSQWDSYRPQIDLCSECKTALETGDFATIAARYTDKRTVTVGAQGGH